MTVGDKCAHVVDAPRDGLAARILDEAIRMFASRGNASTSVSVREVVAACGCTRPTPYDHFTNTTILPDLLDIRSPRARDRAHIEAQIADGVERGELREDLPIKAAAIALVGAMHMWLQRWLDAHPLDEEFERSTPSLSMHGVIA